MLRKAITLLCISLSLATTLAIADTKPTKKDTSKKASDTATPITKSAWDGSNVGLGINITTGNTETKNYNLQANFTFTKHRWTNIFNGSFQRGSASGILNKKVYSAQEQLQYSLNQDKKIQNYLFFMSIAKSDQFSPYRYQCTNTVGYGRDWIKNENVAFSSQAGPGYRRNKDDTGIVRQSMIGFLQAALMWKVTSFSTFNQTFQDTYGSQYNYLTSDTSLTNKLIGNLAIQMDYNVSYYSTIPRFSSNTKNIDTTLNINILYNF
ncbi:MAG: DUF481 domain-containing protein [Gammaproteobacteria bacterium]|nr:DUF481 domain-containing protein [Gammaproteobacteria bacterium]MCH9744327.1 DUF481 domain-containing protein [Gammaproteobacteria bacterium]